MTNERPIVRITRWSFEGHSAGRGKQKGAIASRWVIHGVDERGIERVYAEHAAEAEHQAWCETDPLWHEARRAMFARLMDNPKTHDVVLGINLAAALEAGDQETAAAIARHRSYGAWQRLRRGNCDHEETPDSRDKDNTSAAR